MNILAIETATNVCAAAVVTDTESFEERTEERYVHAEKILGMIDHVLKQSSLEGPKIDGIAVSIGPGSFTGLRVGLSAAKGLAYAWQKPIIGVSTLEGLALRALEQEPPFENSLVLPAVDARRDEVYCGLFRTDGKGLQEEWSPRDMRVNDLLQEIDGMSTVLTGDAVEKILDARNEDSQQTPLVKTSLVLRTASAVCIGKLGRQRLLECMHNDARSLEPVYVKEFYTTTTKTTVQ